jgi:hypothetical protein
VSNELRSLIARVDHTPQTPPVIELQRWDAGLGTWGPSSLDWGGLRVANTADSRFRFDGLRPGDYRLRDQKSGLHTETLHVAAGVREVTARLDLTVLKRVHGRVQVPDPELLRDVRVLVEAEGLDLAVNRRTPQQRFQYVLRVDDDGRFEVRVPWLLADMLHGTPEARQMFAGESDPRCPLGSWEEIYPWLLVQRVGHVPLEVLDIRTAWRTATHGLDTSRLVIDLDDLPLRPGVRIRGRLIDDGGRPIVGSFVSLPKDVEPDRFDILHEPPRPPSPFAGMTCGLGTFDPGRVFSHLAFSTSTDRHGRFELDVPANDLLWLEHTTLADLDLQDWTQTRPKRLHTFSAPTPGTTVDLGTLTPTDEVHRAPWGSLLPDLRRCWTVIRGE